MVFTARPHLPAPHTVDEVIDRIRSVIHWSIAAASPLGYFAVVYYASTIALRTALDEGKFDDRLRMVQFIVTFARRYFDALNRHFEGDVQRPARVWQLAFEANDTDEPIVLQHILVGVNAHDTFDLGITAAVTAGDSLESLHNDFDAVNAILVGQVAGVLDAIAQVSPAVPLYRQQLLGDDVGVVGTALSESRHLAWTFAQQLVVEPEANHARVIDDHDRIFAWWSRRHLNPPPPISEMVGAIAAEESRDTARNIAVLNEMMSRRG
jgi:hypothetical protein